MKARNSEISREKNPLAAEETRLFQKAGFLAANEAHIYACLLMYFYKRKREERSAIAFKEQYEFQSSCGELIE